MSVNDELQRLAKQLQRFGGSGGRRPPAGAGLGAGVVVALVAGGLLLNASLFNGAH